MNWFFILALSLPPILIVFHHISQTAPNYSDPINFTFEPTKADRSLHNIPKIDSHSSDDFFFTLGFLHAQDRLWQMDILRRTSEGTLSEFLSDTHLQKDIFARNFRFRSNAEKLSGLSAKGQYLLQRYAQGVNSYVAHHSLPIEYFLTWNKWRPWTIWDSLCIWRYLSFVLGGGFQHDLLRAKLVKVFGTSLFVLPVEEEKLFEPYFTVKSNELPEELYKEKEEGVREEGMGGVGGWEMGNVGSSNAWVVSGEFTKSGKPILANDPHLWSQMPCLVYLAKGKWGTEEVSGGTIPGMPIFLFGFNSKISWGVTSLLSNTIDLYTNVTTTPLHHYSEEILIKNKESFRFSFDCGKFGCNLHSNPSIFMRWAPDEAPDTSFDGFLSLLSSFSIRTVRKSLEKIVIPHLNVVFATNEGDIGYQVTGLHPLHPKSVSGIKDASVPTWSTFIPFEELPYTINPAKGYIVSANNFPTTSIYKHFNSIQKDFVGSRAVRIDDLLQRLTSKRVKITVKDMKKIQMDEFSTLAAKILPVLLKIVNTTEVYKYFEGWDFQLDKESRQAAVFMLWFSELLLKLAANAPELVESFVFRSMVAKQIETGDYKKLCNLLQVPDCGNWVRDSAFAALEKNGRKAWGAVHRSKYEHFPFGNSFFEWILGAEVEVGGNDLTVNAKSLQYSKAFESGFGAEARFIHDLGNSSQSCWSISTGQSGNPLSPHYKDFLIPFNLGESVPIE